MKPSPGLDPHFNPAKAAAGDPFPFDTAVTGLLVITGDPIDFDRPGSAACERHGKWSLIA